MTEIELNSTDDKTDSDQQDIPQPGLLPVRAEIIMIFNNYNGR